MKKLKSIPLEDNVQDGERGSKSDGSNHLSGQDFTILSGFNLTKWEVLKNALIELRTPNALHTLPGSGYPWCP